MKKIIQLLALLMVMVTGRQIAPAQSNCDSITPSFTVNLSSNPNGTWISSPPIVRDGNCCGTTAPDKCIEFVITLSPLATAINFGIASGAIPPGSMFYQVNCGPPVAVGTPLCLNGPGPYWLTFCKPGNNTNTYQITSIGPPEPSPDDSTGSGCSAQLYAPGLLEDNSLTWTSIFPGPMGAYNSYLNCTTACDTVVVTPGANSPPYIDYVVCGYPASSACVSSSPWCDTIRMYVSPALTASVNPNPATFCSSAGSITLNGTPGGGVPSYTTTWTNGANGTGSIVCNGNTFTATLSGNYSYIVYDQNSPKCPPAVVNVPVTIIPPPQISFTATDECFGGTTVFTDYSTPGSGSVTGWNWTFGDGSACSNLQNPSHNYNACGSYNVILSVTSSSGCSATDTFSISVHPTPVASFTVPNVCYGEVSPFTNLSSVSSGNISSYAWDFGNFSNIDNSQSPNYVYAATGTYNVTLSVVSAAGCQAAFTSTVEVYPKPVPDFASSNVCIGSTSGFTDQSTVGGGQSVNSWTWAFGDGSPVANTQNPSHAYPQSGTYNVSLVVGTNWGCSDTVTKPITIYPDPVVNFSVSDTSTCLNACSQYTDLSTINSGALANWAWSFGDGGSSSQRNPEHCYAKAGSYSVSLTVTSGYGCVSTVGIANYVVVHPSPVAAFSYSPQPVLILEPVVHFADHSDTAATWNWDFGDNSYSSDQHPEHTYADTGTYCITLIIENRYRCADTTLNCLRINPDFAVYIPNAFTPSSSHHVNDVFAVKGIYTGKFDMWIFDRWGNEVFHSADINIGWDGHVNNSPTPVQEDTYVYKVEVYDPAGDLHTYAGVVNLIR